MRNKNPLIKPFDCSDFGHLTRPDPLALLAQNQLRQKPGKKTNKTPPFHRVSLGFKCLPAHTHNQSAFVLSSSVEAFLPLRQSPTPLPLLQNVHLTSRAVTSNKIIPTSWVRATQEALHSPFHSLWSQASRRHRGQISISDFTKTTVQMP